MEKLKFEETWLGSGLAFGVLMVISQIWSWLHSGQVVDSPWWAVIIAYAMMMAIAGVIYGGIFWLSHLLIGKPTWISLVIVGIVTNLLITAGFWFWAPSSMVSVTAASIAWGVVNGIVIALGAYIAMLVSSRTTAKT